MGKPVRVAVVGYGNWGPRIARVLSDSPEAELSVVCDLSEPARASAKRRSPAVRTTHRFEEVLEDQNVDAMYIATPVRTHEQMVLAALEAGKDVLVEKPLTSTFEGAMRCVQRASE